MLSCAHMDGTETRQRKPEELVLPHTLSTGRLPTVSGDGPLCVPESQRVASKPLGTELSRETTLSIGLQVTVPFMFAGLGLSWAGILLNYFQVRGNSVVVGALSTVDLESRQLHCGLSLRCKGQGLLFSNITFL